MADVLVDWPELRALTDGDALPWRGVADGDWDDDDALAGSDSAADAAYALALGGEPALIAEAPVSSGGATPAPPQPLGSLRCLDARHPAACSRCEAAPAGAEAEAWALRCERGRTSGEKKLRALLCRTPEWSCGAAREAAAARAEADGEDNLVQALRSRNVAVLRKRSYFALCRYWALRSDLWTPVGPRPTRRRPPAPPSPQPLALMAPPRAPAAPEACAAALVRRDVGGGVIAFLTYQPLPSVKAACAFEPDAPFGTLDLQMVRALVRTARGVHASLLLDLDVLRGQHAALLAAGDAEAPAWQLGLPPRAEQALHILHLYATANSATIKDGLSAGRDNIQLALGRPLSGPERAHVSDSMATSEALHALLAAAQSALARMRLGGGGAYLAAASAVVEALAVIVLAVADNNEARLTMFEARVPACSWRSTFLDHVSHAGLPPPPVSAA